jgi:hypothetical protein
MRLVCADTPRGEAASQEPAAAPERKHEAGPGSCAHIVENHIYTLFPCHILHCALKQLLALDNDDDDDEVPTQKPGLLHVVDQSRGRDDNAAHALGELNSGRADARSAGLDQDGLAGLKLGIIEK